MSTPMRLAVSGCVRRLDRRAARAPLPGALLDLGEPRAPDRTMQRAVAHKLAVDAVLVDKRVDFRRAAAKQAEEALAIVGAEPLDDVVGREPHAGVDQADVAPRAAEADLDRLERHDLGPGLSQMERRREPGIAAADDRDVSPNLARKRRCRRRGRRGQFPEAVRKGIVLHLRMIGRRPRSFQLLPGPASTLPSRGNIDRR